MGGFFDRMGRGSGIIQERSRSSEPRRGDGLNYDEIGARYSESGASQYGKRFSSQNQGNGVPLDGNWYQCYQNTWGQSRCRTIHIGLTTGFTGVETLPVNSLDFYLYQARVEVGVGGINTSGPNGTALYLDVHQGCVFNITCQDVKIFIRAVQTYYGENDIPEGLQLADALTWATDEMEFIPGGALLTYTSPVITGEMLGSGAVYRIVPPYAHSYAIHGTNNLTIEANEPLVVSQWGSVDASLGAQPLDQALYSVLGGVMPANNILVAFTTPAIRSGIQPYMRGARRIVIEDSAVADPTFAAVFVQHHLSF